MSFAPYTGIHTNILSLIKQRKQKKLGFYRLDMPDGYKNFSKTKPMKSEHFNPVRDWWENREEILEGRSSTNLNHLHLVNWLS